MKTFKELRLEGLGADRTGTKCTSCGKGAYHETSHTDDWDGVLHCEKCGHEVARYTPTPQKRRSAHLGRQHVNRGPR